MHIILLCYLVVLSTSITAYGRQTPLTELEKEPANECGIGFDLTPTYGTSAISCANGTSRPLSMVNGSEQYKSLMQRLLLYHTKPDAPNESEKIRVLGHMLNYLRQSTEEELGYNILAASTTVPWLLGLGRCIGDGVVKGAFAAAGMHYIQLLAELYRDNPVTLPQNSVLAAHGFGLCRPYDSGPQCSKEDSPPVANYLLLGYYSVALEVSLTRQTSSAYELYSYQAHNYQLGSNMIHKNPDEQYYWEGVKDFITNLFANHRSALPAKVICYGDSCDNHQFRRVVIGEIDRFWGSENRPEWVQDDVDPRFASALGTAEFVLRYPYHGENVMAPASGPCSYVAIF